jgi:acyl dehydratase
VRLEHKREARVSRFDEMIGMELGKDQCSWDSDRALLYAVGVGAGQEDPVSELEFTTENTENLPQQVLPSFMTNLSVGGLWLRPLGFKERKWNGLDWGWPEGMVQAEVGVTLARPLPPSGTADLSMVLLGVYDKGSGALVVVENRARCAETGEPIGSCRASYFIRGQGGFGGPRNPPDEAPWPQPDRAPDLTVVHKSSPGQALVYRLSGDRNPHCTDPARAKADGFERPILQGLCTYGFACRALLQGLCEGEVGRFGSMNARLSQPVFPGDVLETRIWRSDGGARFQTVAGDRVVLDRGTFAFTG